MLGDPTASRGIGLGILIPKLLNPAAWTFHVEQIKEEDKICSSAIFQTLETLRKNISSCLNLKLSPNQS